jgi:hypothetical protein
MNNRILGIIVAYGILAAASATLSSSFQIIVSNAFSDSGSGSRAESTYYSIWWWK